MDDLKSSDAKIIQHSSKPSRKSIHKGLGRGLDELLGNFNEAHLQKEYPNYRLELLECAQIGPNPYQPRQFFDEALIEELAQSIAEQGLLQPVVVVEKNGGYQLIAGERRLRAFKKLELRQIPALIRSEDEAAQAMWAVIENLQRQDLNCMEEARALKRLMQEFNLSHEQIAKKMGRSRPYVSNMLRLEQAPIGIQELLENKSIEMGHARCLLGLEPAHQMMLAKRIMAEQLSVRDTERAAREWFEKQGLPPNQNNLIQEEATDSVGKINHSHLQNQATEFIQQQIKDVYNHQELEQDIANNLGLVVHIKHQKTGAGHVLINYHNLAELDFLIEKLKQ